MQPFELTGPALRGMGETRPVPREAALLRAGLHSRRLVLLKTLLTRAGRVPLSDDAARALRRDWRLLEEAESHAPAAAREALGYPAVGNWLAHALAAGEGAGFERALEGLGAVAAVVATGAARAFRLTLPVREGLLTLPGLGAYATAAPLLHIEATSHTLILTPEGGEPTTLPHPHRPAAPEALAVPPGGQGGGGGWLPVRALPGARALLDDQDPHLGRDAGGIAGLRPATVTADEAHAWRELWTRALRLLGAADPERAAEVTGRVRAVVPVWWKPSGRASATRLAAPWAVLTTLPESAEEMAEVLVHEVQHSKLAVLGDMVRLYHEGGEAVFRVGWRADPRPLGAVLQGTYAHLALADLWDRLARRAGAGTEERVAAKARREKYREQVDDALSLLLDSGQLTAEGTEFVEGMRRHHARLCAPARRGPAPSPTS
ncbi:MULTISPECIES: aKG-HExxH-type peptide beta-hydroxylase [unclassified Streptomyces]|uniref:aKG-HExxH-type peptide beta-hydroxylase n=1 Tax=unclassified Streptomyces TaxID=2593676 RepID=UPI002DD9AE4F|nr:MULTISPECIES: HEXXH motif-containing putative peptide modification protein [unclassified Streptomyces]WSB76758.1 HEXXH motif-containing putative peptide modification protein [Streptomyces sp. NBC_01775]WSS14965.1 HEXXH motif-containing putative peptide modification protein [Streptomyces sp. NBC_01186]WSS43809.1 HEXXH motif-containing putative peptide modification protein [Streptomyces sp. NBC_01187]